MYLWSDGDKAYFGTGASKDVYRQLRAHSRVSFCTWDPQTATVLSLDGPVVFVDDIALKRQALEKFPNLVNNFKSADNPEFQMFYIDAETIYTFDYRNGKRYIRRAGAE
jgi:uncharacterized pyridoxamine 5'-phosphate oxidase family protein